MICLVKIDRFPGYLIPPKRLITPKVSSFFGMWKKPLSEKMVSCLESVYFPETFNYSEVKLIFFDIRKKPSERLWFLRIWSVIFYFLDTWKHFY